MIFRMALALFSLILVVTPSIALEVSKVEINPEILFPGDVADGRLYLTVAKDEEVQSISFIAKGIEITPKMVTEIGKISAGSTYELPFTVKAKEAGIFPIEVKVTTKNDTKKQIFKIIVEKTQPILILKSTKLTLNEVNEIEFSVVSSVGVEKIKIEPLFDSDPALFYFNTLDEADAKFRIYPEEEMELTFKISYYNGRNYHEVVQTIPVDYTPSRGVFVSANFSYSVVSVNDVLTLFVDITNLRNDRIYGISVELFADGVSFSETMKELPLLESKQSVGLNFLLSPEKAGKHTIKIRVEYRDEVDNIYSVSREMELTATDTGVLGISNLDVEKTLTEVKVTGDLSNGGRGDARNVIIVISADNTTRDFFVGELESGDFYTFDFTLPPEVQNGTIEVIWTNEIGKTIETFKDFEVQTKSPVKGAFGERVNLMFYILTGAVVVAIFIIIAWMKARKS